MNERKKLIKQIEKAIGNVPFFKSDMEAIVNFILADRKRIEKKYEEIKEKAWKYDHLCK